MIDAQGQLIAIEEFPQGRATDCEIRPRLWHSIFSGTTPVPIRLGALTRPVSVRLVLRTSALTKHLQDWSW